MSRIFYPDGRACHSVVPQGRSRVVEYPPQIAYLIWLAEPGTAIRVAGDDRPVMPWEYYAGATYGVRRSPRRLP